MVTLKAEEHYLVPKHAILTKEEAAKVLEKLDIQKISLLSKIKKSDPAIKKMKPKRGDIVRIERTSRTAGETIYYRRVA